VTLQNWPNGSGSPSPEDDRFWAAAIDLGMRLSPHQAFGDQSIPVGGSAITPEYVLAGQNVMGKTAFTTTLAQLMYHGVFDRFPTIKFYFAETQGAWLANHLDYVDEFYMRWAAYHGLNEKLKKMPSGYIRDHCKFSFIHDRMVMKLRYYIGLDLLMWGSDFPHSVGTFPDSRETLDDLFEGVPEEERRQVLVDNVCDFFGLDPHKELTPTP
jgi:predicted TIM-barrel fold metal-dependent hydrolase